VLSHIGFTARITLKLISLRHKEHLRYMRNNNPLSAYVMHILHNRHQFGPADETLKPVKPCNKVIKINCWEALYKNMIYKQGLLICEKQVTDTNPLFDLATIIRDIQATSPNSSFQFVVTYTHTHRRVSPDPLHQLLFYDQVNILELYRTNLTFLFILQFKITLPNTD